MKKLRLLLCVLLLLSITGVNAQTQFSGWLASFNTIGLNKKLSIHFDAQLRSTDKLEQVGMLLLRPGLNYHFTKSFTATAGYAFIDGRRAIGNVSGLLAEHRIWQQAIYSHKLGSIAVAHRGRFEQRFLPKTVVQNNELEADGYNQAYRFRYFIRNIVPLTKGPAFTKGVFLAVQDEVFLNTGDKSAVNGKTFDQNRLYGAIGYRLPGKVDLEAGYMNQYISGRSGFTNNHIAQIAVYKRL